MIKAGIGSYAFRYGIGAGNFLPAKPMTALDFLDEAHRLGFGGVQLCENLNYCDMCDDALLEIKKKADRLGLFIEVGMKDLTEENLEKHLRITELLSSGFLRVVLGGNTENIRLNASREAARVVKILKNALPYCRSSGLTIGLENHFDFTTRQLAGIAEEINDKHLGLIFDTTNAMGFLEKPAETFEKVKKHLVSVHIKDYIIKKVEAGYFVTGTVLGEGLLDTRGLLASIVQVNPLASIIMEMTIKRDGKMSIEQTLEWEREAIEKSAFRLQDILMNIRQERGALHE